MVRLRPFIGALGPTAYLLIIVYTIRAKLSTPRTDFFKEGEGAPEFEGNGESN